MSLDRLADELDETFRQLTALVEGVMAGLDMLGDAARPPETARREATRCLLLALQGHDRIEQRCRTLAATARALARLDAGAPADGVWRTLSLDELRHRADEPRPETGDIELF